MKFNRMPFGLDVSDISLKLMQFGKNREVTAYSDNPVPKGLVASDMIKDAKSLVGVIKEAVAHPKFGRIVLPYVVASIPETKSFVREIQMPAMTEAEAAEAVPWEAEQYIPMPISSVYLDWVILNPASSPSYQGEEREGVGKMTVLITAAPKDYVDDYVRILKEAGLRPLALEVESQATARSLVSADYAKEAVLIVDIDAIRTSMIIFDRGVLQFTSSLPIAGNAFTEAIAKALTVDLAKAETLKRECGLDPAREKGAVRKALLPALHGLIEEINNTIRFHEEHAAAGAKISRLLLAGGSGKLRNLPSFLQEKLKGLGLRVELGNPWGKVLPARQTPPLSREDSLSYATAIGLALREME